MSFLSHRSLKPRPATRSGLVVLALAVLVGAFFTGCRPDRTPRPSDGALSDSLTQGYQWLEKQYDRMGTPMPSPMRGMQERMQAMRGRMMQGRDSTGATGMMGRMRERMGRGGMMGQRERADPTEDTASGPSRMGHGAMSAMHETMARMHAEQRGRMAARHRKMAQWHEQMMGGSSRDRPGTSGENTQVPDGAVPSGATLFTTQCATCHGQNGQGISGTFPPLRDSEWVTGDVSILARIVLHGLEDPIEVQGQDYDGVMPAFGSRLSDPEIAELLTFLRTSLNEDDSPVTAEDVAQIRDAYDDRSQAWTAGALRTDN